MIVEETDDLPALTAAWRQLADRACALPFQWPEWLVPYFAAFRPRLRLFTLSDGGRLLALLPLCSFDGDDALHLLGHAVSDYLDALVDPDAPPDALDRLLAAASARADRIDLDELRPTSPLLRAAVPPGFSDELAQSSLCQRLECASWPACLSRRLADDLRKYRRRLERIGHLALVAATAVDLEHRLRELFHLHGGRWRARGQPGLLADPAVQRFHIDTAFRLFARGALRLHALTLDGATLAVIYGFRFGASALLYLSGFDVSHPEWSLGTVSLAMAVEQARADGLGEIDLLRGDEPYKRRLGTVADWNLRRVLVRAS